MTHGHACSSWHGASAIHDVEHILTAREIGVGIDRELSAVQHLTTPVAVAVGHDEPGSNPARMGPPLAEALVGGALIRYDHIGHFGPLQDPWSVARDIRRHITGL